LLISSFLASVSALGGFLEDFPVFGAEGCVDDGVVLILISGPFLLDLLDLLARPVFQGVLASFFSDKEAFVFSSSSESALLNVSDRPALSAAPSPLSICFKPCLIESRAVLDPLDEFFLSPAAYSRAHRSMSLLFTVGSSVSTPWLLKLSFIFSSFHLFSARLRGSFCAVTFESETATDRPVEDDAADMGSELADDIVIGVWDEG
jgi:hypothetical protein